MSFGSISLHGCQDVKLHSYNASNSNALTFHIENKDGRFDIDLFDLPDDQFNWIVMCFGKDATNHEKI